MFIKFNEFYQYVFGYLQQIDLSSVPFQHQETRYRKQSEIIKEKFGFILKSDLSLVFRKLLREIPSELEIVLYGNKTDAIEVSEYSDFQLPQDQEIKDKFDELNTHYELLDKTQQNNFIIFFKLSKLIADYLERNNENNNEIAYLHAYKMLVLFGATENINPFEKVEQYLSLHNKLKKDETTGLNEPSKFLRDILSENLPEAPVQLEKWQQIIHKGGAKAITLFEHAHAIELELGKVPHNLDEARKSAMRLKYKRWAEYPLLAELCESFNLNETIFNKCLSIEEKRKVSDNLPNLVIEGNEVNKDGYYLVKLPIDDPRAYVLGHITNCCQSIGGIGEQCVIDGLTRENNGFYVLLKRKPMSKSTKPLLPNGKIDYAQFQIVGQGYAWLSKMGNFTLDGWDNLRPATDNDIVVPLLRKFGETICELNPRILRVMIGIGLTTPDALKTKEVTNPEKIKEGIQYLVDSSRQNIVFIDRKKAASLKEALKKEVNDQKERIPVSESLLNNIITSLYSVEQAEWIKKLFLENNLKTSLWQSVLEDTGRRNNFVQALEKYPFILMRALHELYSAGILNTHNLDVLLAKPAYADDAAILLTELHKNKLLTEENGKLVQGEYAVAIKEALQDLKAHNLLDEKIYQGLAVHGSNVKKMSTAFIALNSNNLLNPEIFDLIVKNSPHAQSIANGLIDLDKAKMLQKFGSLIGIHPQFAEPFATALIVLKDAHLLDDYFDFVLKNPGFAKDISDALIELKNMDLLEENQEIIIANPQSIHAFSLALVNLKNAGLYNRYRELIVRNLQFCGDLSDALINLGKQGMLDDYSQYIIDKPEFSRDVSSALIKLKKNVLITRSQTLLKHPEHAEDIANALLKLKKARILSKNCALVEAHPELARSIASALIKLKDAGLLEKGQTLIAANPYLAREISRALIELNKAGVLDDNYLLIVNNPQFAGEISYALKDLKGGEILDENRQYIVKNPEFARGIATGLVELKRHDIYKENQKFIIENPQYARSVAMALIELKKNELYEQYRQLILENPKISRDLTSALVEMNAAGLLVENAEHITKNPQHARGLASGLLDLRKSKILKKNYPFIIENIEFAKNIAFSLTTLKRAGLYEENRDFILKHPQAPMIEVCYALADLKKAGIYQTFRSLILHNLPHAEGLSYTLITFKRMGILDEFSEVIKKHPEHTVILSKIIKKFSQDLGKHDILFFLNNIALLKNRFDDMLQLYNKFRDYDLLSGQINPITLENLDTFCVIDQCWILSDDNKKTITQLISTHQITPLIKRLITSLDNLCREKISEENRHLIGSALTQILKNFVENVYENKIVKLKTDLRKLENIIKNSFGIYTDTVRFKHSNIDKIQTPTPLINLLIAEVEDIREREIKVSKTKFRTSEKPLQHSFFKQTLTRNVANQDITNLLEVFQKWKAKNGNLKTLDSSNIESFIQNVIRECRHDNPEKQIIEEYRIFSDRVSLRRLFSPDEIKICQTSIEHMKSSLKNQYRR